MMLTIRYLDNRITNLRDIVSRKTFSTRKLEPIN